MKKIWEEPKHYGIDNLLCWIRMFAKHFPGRQVRHWIYRKWLIDKIGKFVRIGLDVEIRFSRKIEIGNNVQINDNVLFMNHGKITLGNGVMVGPGVKFLTVHHDCEMAILDTNNMSIPCWQKGNPRFLPIVIENDVWIGANVVILPGIKVRHHSVIGANSVVSRNVEPYSVIGGVPAKLIRKIKKED